MSPIVSIIIPVYNREEFVLKTLMNIAENSYRPLELILVDDGSSDNSLRIIYSFKSDFQTENFNIVVHTQTNSGAPAARNKGMELAMGDYIQFLDSDDLITGDKFLNDIDTINKKGADIVVSDLKMIFIDDGYRESYFDNSKPLSKVIKGKSISITPLIDARLAKSIRWNEKLRKNQDMDYFSKIILVSKNVAHIPKAQYFYNRYKGENISSGYNQIRSTAFTRLKGLVYEIVFVQKYNKGLKVYLNLLKTLFYFFTLRPYIRLFKIK